MENTQTTANGRLSTGKVWGFAVGTLGEYFVYYLFYTYFLYFLTDYVYIAAGVAGTLMTVIMIWDALTDPVVGYLNDISKNPKGRRRPMMIKTFLPFCIFYALCFMRPSFEGGALVGYFFAVGLAFWLCFTMEQVPFYGLLPEIAQNDQDRMRIRQAMGFIGNGGNLMVSIVPVFLAALTNAGMDKTKAWFPMMAILGVIGGLGFLVTYFVTKGMETPLDKVKRPEKGFWTTYKEIIVLKGFIPVVLVYILDTICLTLEFAAIMYVADSKLGLSAWICSVIVACYTFSGAIFVLLTTTMNKKLGSWKSILWVHIIAVVLFVACGLIGLNNAGIMIFHGLLTGGTFALATAFTYGLLYQIIDVNYLKSDEQTEGSVISFATLGYKVGAAASASIIGWFLAIIGYDGASDMNAEVLGRIDSLLTYFPALLLILAILLLLFGYKMRQPDYEKVLEQKALKMDGKPYSLEGLEKFL